MNKLIIKYYTIVKMNELQLYVSTMMYLKSSMLNKKKSK